jgi:hypothetical protein
MPGAAPASIRALLVSSSLTKNIVSPSASECVMTKGRWRRTIKFFLCARITPAKSDGQRLAGNLPLPVERFAVRLEQFKHARRCSTTSALSQIRLQRRSYSPLSVDAFERPAPIEENRNKDRCSSRGGERHNKKETLCGRRCGVTLHPVL